jgi:hypothetical protein
VRMALKDHAILCNLFLVRSSALWRQIIGVRIHMRLFIHIWFADGARRPEHGEGLSAHIFVMERQCQRRLGWVARDGYVVRHSSSILFGLSRHEYVKDNLRIFRDFPSINRIPSSARWYWGNIAEFRWTWLLANISIVKEPRVFVNRWNEDKICSSLRDDLDGETELRGKESPHLGSWIPGGKSPRLRDHPWISWVSVFMNQKMLRFDTFGQEWKDTERPIMSWWYHNITTWFSWQGDDLVLGSIMIYVVTHSWNDENEKSL